MPESNKMMSLLSGVKQLVFGEDNCVAVIAQGSFYHLDPSIKGNPAVLLYRNASLELRKDFQRSKFSYLLVVTRILGDEEDLDIPEGYTSIDELEAKFNWSLDLSPMVDGQKIKWIDQSDDNCGWQFAVDRSCSSEIEVFEESMYLRLFETHRYKSHGSASDEELVEFLSQAQAIAKAANIGVQKTRSASESVKVEAIDDADEEAIEQILPKNFVGSIVEGTTLVQAQINLYFYDAGQTSFIPQSSLPLMIEIRQTMQYQYHLVLDNGKPIISQEIEPRMNPFYDHSDHSFTWIWFDPATDTPYVSWRITFIAPGFLGEDQFTKVFYNSIYETVNKQSLQKMNQSDQTYLEEIFRDADDMEVDEVGVEVESEDEEDGFEKHMNSKEVKDQQNDGHQNSLLAVGYRNERSFVVRGNQIGVFRHEDNGLHFDTSIKNISTMDGQIFSPKKVMLHQQDSKLVMLHPTDNKKLHIMDLEYGKVVDEWNTDGKMTISDVVPDSKYAQLSHTQTLMGLNKSGMFRLDGRQSGNKIVANSTTEYKTKVGLSAAATTGSGMIAVGSDKGEIRLFDAMGFKRSKTTLPGVGDPILGMDTTEDGKYILATCKTYLLVIDTEVKGETKNAFQKSIKTKPKRLQLKPEHVVWMGVPISFTPARFNSGQGELEKSIITSTGPYVITWNFRKVKGGRLHEYSIKKYTEDVVADNFKYGADRSIIVALPSNVEMVSSVSTLLIYRAIFRPQPRCSSLEAILSTLPTRLDRNIIFVTLTKNIVMEDIVTDEPITVFAPLKASESAVKADTMRRVAIPPHRLTPLRKDWLKIYTPLVENMGLQVRMNLKKKAVEVRCSKETEDIGAVQKAADFIRAYGLGFEVDDAISLLRLDDLYVDTFEVKDVKTLHGDNLSRAIGRIVGKDGKTKFTIENTSRTRIVIADTKIHILGSFQNIKIARDAVVNLIMGASPGKVYSRLRTISTRLKERF